MFYAFRQNNSGGTFDFNDETGIGVLVIVEAGSMIQANRRAESLGIYFNGCADGLDCDCCGDRWYELYDEDSGTDVPMSDDQPIVDSTHNQGWGPAFIHYLDGRVQKLENVDSY